VLEVPYPRGKAGLVPIVSIQLIVPILEVIFLLYHSLS